MVTYNFVLHLHRCISVWYSDTAVVCVSFLEQLLLTWIVLSAILYGAMFNLGLLILCNGTSICMISYNWSQMKIKKSHPTS